MKSTIMKFMHFTILLGFLFVTAINGEASEPKQPNFLILLADDMGYGDLVCYGHEVVKSPHLDRLAKQGVRFTNCYAAAANCSSSRIDCFCSEVIQRI